MQHLEFLPPRYRHRRRSRRSVLRCAAIAGAAATIVVSLSSWQHRQERRARYAWSEAHARFTAAKNIDQELAKLRAELVHARAAADLCVFLQRPWPRSQVLDTIIRVLPAEVELTELHLSQETLPTNRALQKGGGIERRAKEDSRALPPSLTDLRKLREEFDTVQTVVQVAGLAYESASLHHFVAALAREPLVVRCELGAQETVEHPQKGSVTKFSARIGVRPEYGHPLAQGKAGIVLQAKRPAR